MREIRMREMTKRERLQAVLAGTPVDRLPVAFWRHWPIDDQDPEALARASVMKTALVEYYMSMGQWPAKISDVGMGQPGDFAGGPVASIHLEPEGVITIALKPDVAPGAQLRLVPRVTPAGMVEWRCRATGYPAAERLPACQP